MELLSVRREQPRRQEWKGRDGVGRWFVDDAVSYRATTIAR